MRSTGGVGTMNKRVLCILLAAALLCVPALASGTKSA